MNPGAVIHMKVHSQVQAAVETVCVKRPLATTVIKVSGIRGSDCIWQGLAHQLFVQQAEWGGGGS